jgi:pyruvate ferredoxin oxidoreductase gamma subunit
MAAGKYVQGFPEYGPERMGAPMKAYNRIGDIPITIHSNVENPDVVMVLDPTLVGPVNVTEGLKPDGIIIINTTLSPEEAKQKLDRDDIKVATVDASGIAVDCIGRDIPNTPMMGALLKLVEILPFEEFIERMRADLTAKFRGRENIVEGNIKAIRRAYEEVKLA